MVPLLPKYASVPPKDDHIQDLIYMHVLLHRIQPTDYIKICMDRISETLKREEVTPSTRKLFKKPITKYHTLNYLETDATNQL